MKLQIVPLEKCKNAGSAEDFLPARRTLRSLAQAARKCHGCDLFCNATQTVFGEGPADASIVIVGEQPGDKEDQAGRPFVGPAGAVLDRALESAGIDRSIVYVTNAVKHFKFEPRGKRRIHAKPNSREINACLPWLRAELDVIKPRLLVALGATAAQALLGKSFRVTRDGGKPIRNTNWAPTVMATVHPSSILRAPDDRAHRAAMIDFEADLKAVRSELSRLNRR